MIQYINKTKTKTATIILMVLALNLSSCSSILDEQPISDISSPNFWKNNNDAALGVTGIYDALQPTYRMKRFLWGEFRSDNFRVGAAGATQDNIQLTWQNITPGNTSTLKWNDLYDAINRANLAIKYIPTIPGYDKNLLAQAYAIRAYAYFDAVRVWGAVPVFTEPTESVVGIQKSRTPGATILSDVVIPDMLKAEQLVSTVTSNFRFSKGSILCLQADVYMWTKDYAKAKAALDKMIALGTYSLANTVQAWEDLFYNTPNSTATPDGRGKIQTGPELIFSIRYDLAEVFSVGNRSGIMGLFFAGIPSFYMSDVLEAKWKAKFPIDQAGWDAKYPGVVPPLKNTAGLPVYGDFRFYSSREGGYQNIVTNARVAKWTKSNFGTQFDDTDIVIYRYSGMLLLLAEAENQLGSTISDVNTTKALALVNQIRTARKLPTVKAAEFGATKADRENFILDERQFELIGEGQRWWDLRRTNKAIEILNPILSTIPGASLLTEDRLLFPVYFEHLVENPNLLPQNTGY